MVPGASSQMLVIGKTLIGGVVEDEHIVEMAVNLIPRERVGSGRQRLLRRTSFDQSHQVLYREYFLLERKGSRGLHLARWGDDFDGHLQCGKNVARVGVGGSVKLVSHYVDPSRYGNGEK